MEILDPLTHEPLLDEDGNAFIWLVTDIHAPAAKKVRNEFNNKYKGNKLPSAEASEAAQLDLIATCVVGFKNKIKLNGETIDHSFKTVRSILKKSPAIRSQVDDEAGNVANHIKAALES